MASKLDGGKILGMADSGEVLFCYLDESGDLNFSPTGSRYYLYTALAVRRPLPLHDDMLRAKYSIVLAGGDLSRSHSTNDFFHATEDAPVTREAAYGVLRAHSHELRVYSCVADKAALPDGMQDQAAFYSRIAGELVGGVLRDEYVREPYGHVCVLLDRIPVHKKRSAVLGSIKRRVKISAMERGASYNVRPMESQSDFGLQAADYCSWAIYQQRTNGVDDYVGLLGGSVARIEELSIEGAWGEGK